MSGQAYGFIGIGAMGEFSQELDHVEAGQTY